MLSVERTHHDSPCIPPSIDTVKFLFEDEAKSKMEDLVQRIRGPTKET